MADSKYGRLFTEDDVREIVNAAVFAGIELAESGDEEDTRNFHGDAIYDAVVSGVDVKFPEDEPLFVLRAQDDIAFDTILAYYEACKDAGIRQEHLDNVDASIELFRKFRDENPDRVKDPD